MLQVSPWSDHPDIHWKLDTFSWQMTYILVYVLFKRNVLFVSIFSILTNTLFCNVPVMNFNSNILQNSCNTCVRWKNRGFIKSYKKKFLIMKIISNEMCSMQIVGVCGTFCMETDKILIPKLFSLYFRYYTHTLFVTRLIINQINKVQWVDFKLENVLVSLHSLKNNGHRTLWGLGSIIFKEWRVTRTFSYTCHSIILE
jgi:hypothetical protein